MFWRRTLNLGPIHFSVVRNDWLGVNKPHGIGGFITRYGRGFMSTLRIGKFFINLDVWS